MDISFWSSELNSVDLSIATMTAAEVISVIRPYAAAGFGIYFTLELIKMMYMRQPMDLGNLLIAFIVFISMAEYTTIIKEFDQDLSAIYKNLSVRGGNDNVALANAIDGFVPTSNAVNVNTSGMSAPTYANGGNMANQSVAPDTNVEIDAKMNIFDELLTGNISVILGTIMQGFRKTMLIFLYAIGPFCMALAMFPIFGIKVLKNWFFYTLNVHMWQLGFVILQLIQAKIGFWREIYGSSINNELAMASANILNCVCFAMVPYLTAKMLIGLSQASSFSSRATGAVAAAGGYIMGSKKGGGKSDDSKGSLLSKSISAFKEGATGSSGGGSGTSGKFAQAARTAAFGGAGKLYANATKGFKR